jgi:hypothetical protein
MKDAALNGLLLSILKSVRKELPKCIYILDFFYFVLRP